MNTMLYASQHREDGKTATKPAGRSPVGLRAEVARSDQKLQAGMILNLLYTLPEHERCVLVAKYRRPHVVCSCRNPCCSGFRRDKDWVEALKRLAELLAERSAEDRTYGLASFKTAMPLMERLLQRMFDPRGFRLSQKDIAEVCGVHENTVVKHGKYLGGILDDWLADGLTDLDDILVPRGIVGALE